MKACQDVIPTKTNLVRRTIITDPLCERCSQAPEDTLHGLWTCSHLDAVWNALPNWNFKNDHIFSSFKEVVQFILDSNNNLEIFAMQVWAIWNHRNQSWNSRPCCPINQLSQLAKTRYDEFVKLTPSRPSPQHHPRTLWQAPPPNLFKINYNGAVFQEFHKSGIGVLIRDSHGLVIASMSQVIPQLFTAIEVEAAAAARALEFALELGVTQAVL